MNEYELLRVSCSALRNGRKIYPSVALSTRRVRRTATFGAGDPLQKRPFTRAIDACGLNSFNQMNKSFNLDF